MGQGRSEAVFMDEISAADKDYRNRDVPESCGGSWWAPFLFSNGRKTDEFSSTCGFIPPQSPLLSYHSFPGMFASTSGKAALCDMIIPARLKPLWHAGLSGFLPLASTLLSEKSKQKTLKNTGRITKDFRGIFTAIYGNKRKRGVIPSSSSILKGCWYHEIQPKTVPTEA